MNNLLSDSSDLPHGQGLMGSNIEASMQAPMSSEGMIFEDFFEQVQTIEKQIEKVSSLLKKLHDAHEESMAVTKAAAVKAIKQRMEIDIREVRKVALLAKMELVELDKDNLNNRQKPGCGKGSSVDRSRTSTTVALKKKLKEQMSGFQTLRETIQREYREVVERRIFTVTGNHADKEVIDKLIETGNSEQIFEKAILEQGRGQILDTLAEIQERHDSVKELQKKLLELQQIFLDLAVLVEAQGDLLDDIEAQVSTAANYVQDGTTALQEAKVLQKNSRKWICIAIIVLLAISAVIVLVVLRPWSKSSKNGLGMPGDMLSWHGINSVEQWQRNVFDA